MSDSDRCRATAARYGRLASMTASLEVQKSYRELERLWLEMADRADRLSSGDNQARRRFYELVDHAAASARVSPRLQ